MWASNGLVVNPSVGDILADTGPLSVGAVSFTITAWTDDGPQLDLEHRNALNTATLHSMRFIPGGVGLMSFTVPVVLLLNERIRVVVAVAPYGGTTQATIFSA